MSRKIKCIMKEKEWMMDGECMIKNQKNYKYNCCMKMV